MLDRILQTLHVEPEESKLVGLSLLQSFLIGIPRVFTVIVASALFLEHFDPSDIPVAYIVSAPIVAAFGVMHVRLLKRGALGPAVATVLGILAVALMILRALVDIPQLERWATAALFIWTEAEWTLASVTFWGTVNRVYTVRQAKRLFGLVSVGEVIPTIVGGLCAAALVNTLGVPNLLFISIAAHAAAAFNAISIARLESPSHNTSNPEDDENETKRRLLSPYVVLIGTMVSINTVIYYFVDNAFFHSANRAFPAAEDLASFLGYFFVALGVAHLLFKTIASRILVQQLGIKGSLAATPFLIMVLGLVGAICSTQAGPALGLMMVAAVKVSERVLVNGLYVPVYYTLFQPFRASLRTRLQSTIDTVVGQSAGCIGGIILLVLGHALDVGAPQLMLGAVVMSGVWLALSWPLSRGYRQALGQSLKRHQAGVDLVVRDPRALETIEAGLRSPHRAHVIYCLELLVRAQGSRAEEALISLLRHDASQVRMAALAHLEHLGSTRAASPVRALIESETNRRVEPVAFRALAATDVVEHFEFLLAQTNAPDELRSDAATIALLRYGGIEGAVAAGPKLLAMRDSPDSEQRKRAAFIIGAVENPGFFKGLVDLLEDWDTGVQMAACVAAGKVKNARLWPLVAACLSHPGLRAEAAQALRNGGAGVVDTLSKVFHDQTQDESTRRLVVRTLGLVPSKTAVDLLREALLSSKGVLLKEALAALHAQQYQARPHEQETIEANMEAHFAGLVQMLQALELIGVSPERALVARSINDAIDQSLAFVLECLGFLYDRDSIRTVQQHIEGTNVDAMDRATEFLENTLQRKHAKHLVPVIEGLNAAREAAAAIAFFGTDDDDESDALLRRFHETPPPWLDPWITRCIAVAIGAAAEDDEMRLTTSMLAVGIFDGVAMRIVSHFVDRLVVRELIAGERLLECGNMNDALWVVVSGGLREDKAAGTTWGRGAVIDELAVLRASRVEATVVADSPARILRVTQGDLTTLMNEEFDVAWAIMVNLCRRLRIRAGIKQGSARTREWTGGSAGSTGLSREDEWSAIEKIILVGSTSIFRGLDDHVLTQVVGAANEGGLDRGEALARQGERGDNMFVLLEGRVRVEIDGAVVAHVEGPEVLGELSAIDPAPRSASLIADTPTRYLQLSQPLVYELLFSERRFFGNILDLLIQRLGRIAT